MMPFTKIDKVNKVSETETHVFFLSNEFSQWHMGLFWQRLTVKSDPLIFNCAEQYMMASKAVLFGDFDTAEAIMATGRPRTHKELGRAVKNFDLDVWNSNAQAIVRRGNLAKFSLISACREVLLATGDKTLVEGAHYDPVWGVKLAWDDPRIVDPANWRGTNWLGQALMDVRAVLREQDAREADGGSTAFDPFAWAFGEG